MERMREYDGLTVIAAVVWIASIARTNNLLLVTRNTADFSAIPGLYLEDWFAGGES
jgi:predicted nucleic acid-binding protein